MSHLRLLLKYRLVWVAFVVSILFWIGDSVLDGFVFEKTGYWGELWPDDRKELWMACSFSFFLVFAVLSFIDFSGG